jgi:hypothetical protein
MKEIAAFAMDNVPADPKAFLGSWPRNTTSKKIISPVMRMKTVDEAMKNGIHVLLNLPAVDHPTMIPTTKSIANPTSRYCQISNLHLHQCWKIGSRL